MHSEFQPLSALLQRSLPQRAPASPVEAPVVACRCAGAHEDAIRSAKLFRAAVAEGVNAVVSAVLKDIAADVVARELQLAPADIQAVVHRALSRYLCEDLLHVRVHPDDARDLRCEVPVHPDSSLRRGDVQLELRTGTVDASLGARLAAVLREAQS